MSRTTTARLAAAAALGLTGALTLTAAPAQAEEPTALADRYVALGDSFTAGPLIPGAYGKPALCLRSSNNYPNVVADAIGATEFLDVSCSAAITDHMTQPQALLGPDNPPQFDTLTPDTSLVTVGIGGNDFGFADVLIKCASLSATNPGGDPCKKHYTRTGEDELELRVSETAVKVAEVLGGIKERSPDATVAIVGYLQILPENEGCWPKVPVADDDVPYLDQAQTNLNAAIAKEADNAGVTYVDVFERGHDVCGPRADKWVEGIFPTKPAAPVHPNVDGMAVVGGKVVESLGGGGGGAPLA
ncbi:GDSL-like lipase/acylhydrolase family protein [Murinocardiopsis flavida]|uniref:GDSL-like lipase/acylhydrolase family protein n=1 Tax=Murinocardiopsis flavida TaxID=645275 RepID=A0A2P8D0Y7_9ACTN|nr:SGNH/GDSL hydrolase family protein [Murinocardiopsis flavida]PSK90878.1 GDSL-like lipase/acylhydrolase family protein [Murinocardiopsis flavida]